MPTITFEYAARAPLSGLQEVLEQMRLVHRYRNRLAEIERGRRERCEAALREHAPPLVAADAELASAEAALEALRAVQKQANAASRSRVSARDPAAREALRQAREAVAAARQRRRELRQALYAEGGPLQAALAAIAQEAADEARAARHESGLTWHNYQMVEEAAAQFHIGPPPKFRRWDGGGSIAVHCQPAMPVEEALAGARNTLRIELAEGPYASRLWLRVGSRDPRPGEPKKPHPIWCVVPFSLSRSLPAGAKINWARLIRRRYGTAVRWAVQLVLSVPQLPTDLERADAGTVGINLGWRSRPDGSLRVLYWYGSDGRHGEFCLPAELVRRDEYPDVLESIRDRLFNGVRSVLAAWISGAPAPAWLDEHIAWLRAERLRALGRQMGRQSASRKQVKRAEYSAKACARQMAEWQALRDGWPKAPPELPEWFREATATLPSWRSQNRLAALYYRWHDQAFEGDALMYAALGAWLHRDRHLCDWAAFQRLSIRRARNDMYHKFVAGLMRNYRIAVLPKVNWKKLLEEPDADREDKPGLQRAMARLAAPGELSRCIKEKMEVRHVQFAPVTGTCHQCGGACAWDRRQLEHTCEHCGATWDQDYNAAVNALAAAARGEEVLAEEGDAPRRAARSRRNRRSRRDRSPEEQ
jgi:hypothetical protein